MTGLNPIQRSGIRISRERALEVSVVDRPKDPTRPIDSVRVRTQAVNTCFRISIVNGLIHRKGQQSTAERVESRESAIGNSVNSGESSTHHHFGISGCHYHAVDLKIGSGSPSKQGPIAGSERRQIFAGSPVRLGEQATDVYRVVGRGDGGDEGTADDWREGSNERTSCRVVSGDVGIATPRRRPW